MRKSGWSLLILVSLAVSSCNSPEKKSSTTNTDANWSGQMQNMAQDVKTLLPFLYNREAFQDSKNREQVGQALKDFAQAAKHVKPEMGKRYLGDDLLVDYALSNLNDDLARSVHSFQAGQFEYSRSVAKASLSYCFQCHSVTHEGASAAWDLDQLQNLNLAPLEKADLLVATRKYDKALGFMEGLISSPDFVKNNAFDFESLLRRYLALIIRVEKAPHRALRELDKISDKGETPRYIFEQAEGWKNSLHAWEKEKSASLKTSQALFTQIDKRFKKAESLQHFEKDHAGDVEYLRITEELHQGLKILKEPKDQARALFLLGRAYEVLDELGSWNLHETYYEACIDRDPKGTTAKNCFSRLEASLYMGYSGSSGTHLPSEEKERLKRLRDKIAPH